MFWLWFWDAYFSGPTSWTTEPADPGDAAEFAELHAAAFAHGWSVTEMEDMLRDRAVVACALRRSGRPGAVGFALSRVGADEAELISIAVAETRRGTGGGAALLGAHLGRLMREGVRRVALEVDESNAAAIALYGRYGFVAVGRREAYYRKRDGGRAAASVMALDIA